jgi:hypothetical protein
MCVGDEKEMGNGAFLFGKAVSGWVAVCHHFEWWQLLSRNNAPADFGDVIYAPALIVVPFFPNFSRILRQVLFLLVCPKKQVDGM